MKKVFLFSLTPARLPPGRFHPLSYSPNNASFSSAILTYSPFLAWRK